MQKFVSFSVELQNPTKDILERKRIDGSLWDINSFVIPLIELFNKYNIKASFFVNVFEYALWGKYPIKKTLEFVESTGHETGLLTNPIWIDEKKREFLTQYNYDEQKGIIESGIELYEEALGKTPLIHRSNGYAINADTVEVLKNSEIELDSSQLYGSKNTKEIYSLNNLVQIENLVVAPVTSIILDDQIVQARFENLLTVDIPDFIHYIDQSENDNFLNITIIPDALFNGATIYEQNFDLLENVISQILNVNKLIPAGLNELATGNISALETFVPSESTPKPQSIKKVLFVKANPQLRICKQAKALRLQNDTDLFLICDMYDENLMDGIFDTVVQFGDNPRVIYYDRTPNGIEKSVEPLNNNNIFDIIKIIDPDIIHTHAEPNQLPKLLMEASGLPVVFDAYDFTGISTGMDKVPADEKEAEKYCFENAAGIVRKGSEYEIDFYREHDYKIDSPEIQWMDYPDADLFVDENEVQKLSSVDGEIHLVYTGTIVPTYNHEYSYVYYIPLAKMLAKQGIHFHIYPNPYQYNNAHDYHELDKNEKYFHFHEPVNYFQLSKEIAKYDWGTWIHPVKGVTNLKRVTKEKQKVAIGNKLFTYLEAGLPVICSSHLEWGEELLKTNNIGFGISDDNLDKMAMELKKYNYNEIRNNVFRYRAENNLGANGFILSEFYDKILNRRG